MGVIQNDEPLSQWNCFVLNEIKQNKKGRYEIKLPFKDDHAVLPDNFDLCNKRLKNKLRTLKQNPTFLKTYDQVFQGEKQWGIIEETDGFKKKARKNEYLATPCHIETGQRNKQGARSVWYFF